MLEVYAEIIERLRSLHNDMKQAIEGLPQEALDWIPGSEINSLSVLVIHTAGAERYWIGDVIGGDDSRRVRGAEFRVKGISTNKLNERLDEVLSHSEGVLAALNLDDLGTIRTSPRDGRKVTVAWSLVHALEHTGLHLGHMQIIRQLWDQSN
jgi:uncharacterized damage-inducible protein DinB